MVRRHRRLRARYPWVRAIIPTLSPYTDRLRDAVLDGHRCRPMLVQFGDDTVLAYVLGAPDLVRVNPSIRFERNE